MARRKRMPPGLEAASNDPVRAMRVMRIGLSVARGSLYGRASLVPREILSDLLDLADRVIAKHGVRGR